MESNSETLSRLYQGKSNCIIICLESRPRTPSDRKLRKYSNGRHGRKYCKRSDGGTPFVLVYVGDLVGNIFRCQNVTESRHSGRGIGLNRMNLEREGRDADFEAGRLNMKAIAGLAFHVGSRMKEKFPISISYLIILKDYRPSDCSTFNLSLGPCDKPKFD